MLFELEVGSDRPKVSTVDLNSSALTQKLEGNKEKRYRIHKSFVQLCLASRHTLEFWLRRWHLDVNPGGDDPTICNIVDLRDVQLSGHYRYDAGPYLRSRCEYARPKRDGRVRDL